jgi:hypothetical protein
MPKLSIGALQTPPFHDRANGQAHGGWSRNSARPGPPVSAWNSALSEHLCTTLLQDAERLFGSGHHWIDADATPRCAIEQLALDILRFHMARGEPARVLGCEWWVQVRDSASSSPSIGLHWDKDEVLMDVMG